ncbi:MAG: electron transfer flavoprotein subunit alpha/FixB family protein, partial [Steroidobacteraceae bacterium]
AEVWPQAVGKLLELTEASPILTPFSWDTAAASARLAVERNLSLISDAVALARGEGGGLMAERAIFSGKLIARLRVSAEAPALVLVRPGAWHPAPGATARPVEVVEVDTWEPPRVRVVEAIEPSGGDEDLTRAEVVFAVGRGIGSQGNLHLFASAARRCGASLGASRPLVDMGWLPRSQQVGQSGVTVKPRVYVAFGISGAVQHLAGMSAANTIVAVNTDQDAPIFDTAHLGSFVDALEVAKYLAND